MNRIRSIALLTSVIMLAGIIQTGCKTEESAAVITATGTETSTETGEKCYSSKVYTIDAPGCVFRKLFKMDDKYCALFSKREDSVVTHRLYVRSEGEDNWSKYVELDDNGERLGCLCPMGNNRIAASTYYGFNIYDLDTGKLVAKNDDLYVFMDGVFPQVYECDNGFVLLTDDHIYNVSSEGEIISDMSYQEEGQLIADESSFFELNGKYYLALDCDMYITYYEVDLSTKTLTEICNSKDVGFEYMRASKYGKYQLDKEESCVYRIDPDNKSKIECARTQDMLIKPMAYFAGYDPKWFFFDDDHYAIQYEYPDGRIEIVMISPDYTLNLSQRTKLTIKGFGIHDNYALVYTAYKYNTSQDKFLITLGSYDIGKYGYSTAAEAQNGKLRLLKEFSNGNAPDIFYGSDFDYEQMGRMGLVIDMADYIKDSKVINKDTITPNIYDLYYDNGHCYQLFPGYTMFGLWSVDGFTKGNNNMTLDDMSSSSYSSKIFGGHYASDVADFAIRYPIKKLISNGELISEDEMEKIVQFAIDNGLAPDAEQSDHSNTDNIGKREQSVCQLYVGGINSFVGVQFGMKDKMRFVGYPTLNGSVHIVSPSGLVAVSADTEYPEECIKFIEMMYSDDVQKALVTGNAIPANKKIYNEVLEVALDRSKMSDDVYYCALFDDNNVDGHIEEISQEDVEAFKLATDSVDTIMTMDWGIYNIVVEEINSYYLQKRSVKDIAHSLRSRLKLYVDENY